MIVEHALTEGYEFASICQNFVGVGSGDHGFCNNRHFTFPQPEQGQEW